MELSLSDLPRQERREIVSAQGIEKRFGELDVLRGIEGIDVPPISAYCMSEHVRRGFVLGFGNTSAERIAPSLALFQQAIASVHSRRSDQPIMAP